MKKPFSLRTLLFGFTVLSILFSCKKVNEATFLGDDLVPEVDNINTFDTTFSVNSDNIFLNDTTKLEYDDPVALGAISDPEFGTTNAAVYFQISPASYGTYPFAAAKDSITIDSVVLSLDYQGGYGDTITPQTVRVFEIASTSSFNDTTNYPYSQTDFETTGAELGSASFSMRNLDDSVAIIRDDTVKVANQLRIKLTSNELGDRFRLFDTTGNVATGGYKSDTLFKSLFHGLVVKADDGAGNGLAYFDLSSTGKTALTIYYTALKNGVRDTTELSFTHKLRYLTATKISAGGQANVIRRQRAGGWDAYLNNGTAQDDKLYLQSTPGGSAGYITVPGLRTFGNRLIHRAELIASQLPSTSDNILTAPEQLFLDKTSGDSAFLFSEYLLATSSGFSYNYSLFGGNLRSSDATYRFNITTMVQSVLAHDSTDRALRIYAPFKTAPFAESTGSLTPLQLSVLPFPAYGRVVLAGGNYADETKRLRLRVVYSKL